MIPSALHAHIILQLCIQTWQSKHHIKPPKLIILKHKRYYNSLDNIDQFGSFSFVTNTISVRIHNHSSLLSICDTILHEYRHHLQKDTYYNYKHAYHNHPMELAAIKFAKKHRAKIARKIRKFLPYLDSTD